MRAEGREARGEGRGAREEGELRDFRDFSELSDEERGGDCGTLANEATLAT